MIRTLNRLLTVLLAVALPTLAFTFASDVRTEHTESSLSTQASDWTTYESGDADAFNATIARLASEYGGPPVIVGDQVVPNMTVSIFKVTGKAYVTKCLTRKSKGDESIVSHV